LGPGSVPLTPWHSSTGSCAVGTWWRRSSPLPAPTPTAVVGRGDGHAEDAAKKRSDLDRQVDELAQKGKITSQNRADAMRPGQRGRRGAPGQALGVDVSSAVEPTPAARTTGEYGCSWSGPKPTPGMWEATSP